ncbi:radical SAM protein [Candidatus Woesearchaeota archaeon]|nr:radical SAM protein [Candidatus Woesearchaeota archaeon]
MKRNILLVNPKTYRFSARFPYTGLFSIGTILDKSGIDVEVADCDFSDIDIFKKINETEPWLVGITFFSSNLNTSLKIAEFAKVKGSIVVAGGAHVSAAGKKILRYDCIDYAIKGEAEYSFLKLCQHLLSKENLENVPGLIFKQRDTIVENAPKRIDDLDKLPFPEYELGNIKKTKVYPLITSRGCPYKCIFCSEGNTKWKARSPENIIEEIITAQKYYPEIFCIYDDNFAFDINRAKKFCRLILKNNLDIRWIVGSGIRADKIDDDFADLLKRSGCETVFVAMESADKHVFRNLNKGETLETIKKAVKILKKKNLKVICYFIIGLPKSTYNTEMKSIEFVKKYDLDGAAYFMATPFYSTELYSWVKKNATLLKEPVDNKILSRFSMDPNYETKSFKKEDIKKAYAVCNLRAGNYRYELKNPLVLYSGLIYYSLRYDPVLLPIYLLESLKMYAKKGFNMIKKKIT